MSNKQREMLDAMHEMNRLFGDRSWQTVTHNQLSLQAQTQEEAREIRHMFPAAKWERTYSPTLEWWEWKATVEGIAVQIYAIQDQPECCKPIYEDVTTEVAVETKEVTERKLVGYTCGEKA